MKCGSKNFEYAFKSSHFLFSTKRCFFPLSRPIVSHSFALSVDIIINIAFEAYLFLCCCFKFKKTWIEFAMAKKSEFATNEEARLAKVFSSLFFSLLLFSPLFERKAFFFFSLNSQDKFFEMFFFFVCQNLKVE